MVILIVLAVYLFTCYVFFRIGQKFRIGSFGNFCIPFYNSILLCECAGISPWLSIIFYIPMFNFLIFSGLGQALAMAVSLLCLCFYVYLWGTIAARLGKSFWAYGLGGAFLGIPVIVLAFSQETTKTPISPPPQRSSVEPIVSNPSESSVEPSQLSPCCLIHFTLGEYAGNTIELPSEGIIIGRDPSQANIVFKSDDVSRAHVRIYYDSPDAAFVVQDLFSTNGTYYQNPLGEKWEKISGAYRVQRAGVNRFRVGNGVAEFEIRPA